MLDAVTAFTVANRTADTGLARFSNRPEIAREVTNFKKAVASAKSVEELLNNHSVMTVMLVGHGLGEDVPYLGKAKRILTESIANNEALMYRLGDKNYQELARNTRFSDKGLDWVRLPTYQQRLVDKFVKAKYEENLGTEMNSAVPLALYFREKAADIDDALDILSDGKLRKVVLTALGIPEQIAFQSVETQTEAINRRLDVKNFKDPAFLDKFVKRYLISSDQQNSSSIGGANAWQLTLFNIIV